MKNGKAVGQSGVVSEMLKAAGKADIDVIIDLVNHMIVKGVISSAWEVSAIVNCCKWKSLKLTDQTLGMAEKMIKKLIRKQVDIDEMR